MRNLLTVSKGGGSEQGENHFGDQVPGKGPG
jgi:hypothetical protein